MRPAAAALALAGAILAAAPAPAQELARRVAAAGDGIATFTYPIRDDVEVCDRGVRIGDDRRMSWGRWRSGEPERCASGEARVELELSGGNVREVELRPADGSAPRGVDLGRVAPEEAVAWLLSLARGGATDAAAEDALPAAALARDAEAWPGMLEIARDRAIAGDVRETALFWVSQSAADVIAGDLAGIVRDAGEEQDVKNAAVFALSRRPAEEAVPVLMELARTAGEEETRRTAMFWLARSDDPRVVPFFEAILRGRTPPG